MDTITTLPQPPPSIAELRHISAALSQFLRDYDDLHYHIGCVNSAIDEKLSVHFEGTAVNFNDFALTPLVDSSTSNSVRNVLEGSVVERNPRGNVSECLFSDDDNVLEGVVSERKRNECVVDGDVRMNASSDSLIKDSDHRVVNDVLEGVVVTEGKCEGSASECEWSDEDVKMYESANYVKKREESDCDGVVNDVLEGVVVTEGKCEGSASEGEQSDDDAMMYESTNCVKKCEESDCDRVVNDVFEGVVVTEGKYEGSVSESESECERSDEDAMMYESTSYVQKREEIDCDGVVNDVSEEKPKGDESDFKRRNEDVKNDEEIDASVKMEESDCEQSDYDVRMRQSPNSSDSCEETDDEDEEIGALKNAVTTRDEGEKIDAAKNVEETDYDPALNERMNELLEEKAVIEKNPIRTASKCNKVRTPQSSSSLENSEETDVEDGELLEDIDVVPKPDRTASDSDQSFDKPQSPTFSKNHLDEIDVSMNPEDKNHEQTDASLEPGEIDILNTLETNVSEKHEEMDIPKNPVETDVLEKHEEMDISKNPEETDVSKKPEETDVSEKPENVEILKNPKRAVSELERLCKSMSGLEMKKYVVKHISDIDRHQKELLKALKLAINPAKLVLDSIGTYFLQSGKTYNRGSYQYLNDEIDGRQASLFILACFVMISGDGIEISREDDAYAAEAANLWKNRIIKEGGLISIEEEDARGLLLLISGFGISDRHFSIVDIMYLMMASNVKGISNILRHSIVLMPKIPEVIDMLVMKKLEVEAADIAYTFGLEDKCHPLTILTKFLQNVIDRH